MSSATIAAWRAQGAQHLDPVRFCYLEALARRAAGHEGAARRVLDGKLAQALAEYGARLEQARCDAGQALAQQTRRHPDAAASLQGLHAQGDFKAQHQLANRLQAQACPSPLTELLRQLHRQGTAHEPASPAYANPAAAAQPPAELNAMRQFRSTWTRLRVDQQMTRSLAQVPDNPGPLNSHLLVLRSLRLMQDISPAYLQGFMVQMETLLWLDEAQAGGAPVQARPVRRESPPPRRKAGPGKAG